jgi:hypothetical protein
VLIAEIMMETSGNIDFLVSPVSATPTQSRRPVMEIVVEMTKGVRERKGFPQDQILFE